MFSVETIANYVNNYRIENGEVYQIINNTRRQIFDEKLILEFKVARMIYNEVLLQFRAENNENEDEFEKAIGELANRINEMTYANPKGDNIISNLLSKPHLSKILTLNANTKEEAIKEIEKQNLSESLFFSSKYDNTLSLLKLKFRESNLDIYGLDVKLEKREENKWELIIDYKLLEYLDIAETDTLENAAETVRKVENLLEEARKNGNPAEIVYYEERREVLRKKQANLILDFFDVKFKQEELENQENEGIQKDLADIEEFLQSEEAQNIEEVKRKIDYYRKKLSNVQNANDATAYIERINKLEGCLTELEKKENEDIQKDLADIEEFLQSEEAQNIEEVKAKIKYYEEKSNAKNASKTSAYIGKINQLIKHLAELEKKENEDIPENLAERINEVTQNTLDVESLYENEETLIQGIFTVSEFYDYLNQYTYRDGEVYKRTNSERVEDEEIILKMKAIFLVDALARKEIKEKLNGLDPVTIPEKAINHYLRIFSEEVNNSEINSMINNILRSGGNYKYTTEIVRENETIEEDIKHQNKLGLKSVLALFIDPILPCTEAIIALLERKKGNIIEGFNTLFKDLGEGKIELTVNYFKKRKNKKIESQPELDIMTVPEVRYYCEYFTIKGNKILDINEKEIVDEAFCTNVRVAHLISSFANSDADEEILQSIIQFSMYGNSEIAQFLMKLVHSVNNQEEWQHCEISNPSNKIATLMASENINALLAKLFKKTGKDLKEFNYTVKIENETAKMVFDYQIVDPNKKDVENPIQQKFYTPEAIIEYAKTYEYKKKEGKLYTRDTKELITDEEEIVRALAAKFVYNIILSYRDNGYYQSQSVEEKIEIAYNTVLNNFLINDIISKAKVGQNFVQYELNREDEELEFILDSRNQPYFEYYIKDQLRALGYDMDSFRIDTAETENQKYFLIIDYNIIDLEQTEEKIEILEDPLEDPIEEADFTNYSNFTPTIAINILTQFINGAIEDTYKGGTLNDKKVLLNLKMTATGNIEEQMTLQIRQKAIDLINCFQKLSEKSDERARALREKEEKYLALYEEDLLKFYDESQRINLSDNELLLLPIKEQTAFYSLKESIIKVMEQSGFTFSETENENINKNNNSQDNTINYNNYDTQYDTPNLEDYESIEDLFYNITIGDLIVYQNKVSNLFNEKAQKSDKLKKSLDEIQYTINSILNNCSYFYYFDNEREQDVLSCKEIYLDDILHNNGTFYTKNNINADKVIYNIQILLEVLKEKVDRWRDINTIESFNFFEKQDENAMRL